MAAQFQFVVRSGPSAGKTYPLDGAELTVGRDTANPVSINDAEVSRKHAKLSWKGAGYVLEDLGSTNGTFINGVRISAAVPLKPGDAVSFGENIVVMYEAVFDPNATMVASAKSAPKTMAPASAPVPAPVPAPAPAPAPSYSGQVPAGPAPVAAPVPAKKKGGSKAWIVILVVVLLVLCLCIGLPVIVDTLKMDCVMPFKAIANLVGPMFGYAACP